MQYSIMLCVVFKMHEIGCHTYCNKYASIKVNLKEGLFITVDISRGSCIGVHTVWA